MNNPAAITALSQLLSGLSGPTRVKGVRPAPKKDRFADQHPDEAERRMTAAAKKRARKNQKRLHDLAMRPTSKGATT